MDVPKGHLHLGENRKTLDMLHPDQIQEHAEGRAGECREYRIFGPP
jgi:hypothetical protein